MSDHNEMFDFSLVDGPKTSQEILAFHLGGYTTAMRALAILDQKELIAFLQNAARESDLVVSEILHAPKCKARN